MGPGFANPDRDGTLKLLGMILVDHPWHRRPKADQRSAELSESSAERSRLQAARSQGNCRSEKMAG